MAKGINGNELRFYPIIWYGISDEEGFENLQTITMIRDIYSYLFQQFEQYR